MKHLKLYEDYTQEEDEMSDEEVKQEVLDRINKLKSNTNSWATRDTLRHFTEWGFWSGNIMAIIDVEMADDIARELYDYAEQWKPGHPNLEEVYDALYKY